MTAEAAADAVVVVIVEVIVAEGRWRTPSSSKEGFEFELEVERGRFATQADVLVDESTEVAVPPAVPRARWGDCTLAMQPSNLLAHERAARPSTR